MYFFMLVAALMAALFALVALQRPRPAPFLAVVLWAAYAIYEYFVANGTLCDPNCNIRVDLVLFFPLLGTATFLALKKEPSTIAVAALAVTCLVLAAWIASMLGYKPLAIIAGLAALIVVAMVVKSRVASTRS